MRLARNTSGIIASTKLENRRDNDLYTQLKIPATGMTEQNGDLSRLATLPIHTQRIKETCDTIAYIAVEEGLCLPSQNCAEIVRAAAHLVLETVQFSFENAQSTASPTECFIAAILDKPHRLRLVEGMVVVRLEPKWLRRAYA